MPTPAADHSRARELLAKGPTGRAEAMPLLTAAAEAGHAPSQALLAELLLDDLAADPAAAADDAAHALALLRAAAGAGHARAQFRLGLLHAQGGAGLAKDLAEARRWCQAAADQGLAAAQFNLGLLHAEADQAEDAAQWWRLAAINGVAEAEGCLDLLYRDGADSARPRTWDEAETRASVALERSDPEAAKTMRFADFYVDPCLDLLVNRHRLRHEQAEEILQQFFLELEEPLERGEHRGRPWKDSMRERYQKGRGAFRPYLRQVLVNFTRDWLRRQTRRAAAPAAEPAPEPLDEAMALRGEWLPLLDAFAAAMAGTRANVQRAVAVAREVLAEGTAQADLGQRLGVSERTLRNDLRLGVEMLRDWLAARTAPARAGAAPVAAEALDAGLRLLPEWLHSPSRDKRGRALLFLVLVQRRWLGP